MNKSVIQLSLFVSQGSLQSGISQSTRKNRFENRLLPSRYLWVRSDCFKKKAVWMEWSARGVMGRGGIKIAIHPMTPHEPILT